MNIEKETEKFLKLTQDEQKQCCLIVLDWVKEFDWVIDELYALISTSNPPMNTLIDVYVSALTVLYETNQTRILEAQNRLKQNHKILEDALKMEKMERNDEILQAESTLIF